MKIKVLLFFLSCIMLGGCSLKQEVSLNTFDSQNIISGSDTLKSHLDVLGKSVFENNSGTIEISKGERNIMFQGTRENLKNKSVVVTTRTGIVTVSFMTYNPVLKNSIEPLYKGPFTNNIIMKGENIKISETSLSGYLDNNDKILFILVGNIDSKNSVLEYNVKNNF